MPSSERTPSRDTHPLHPILLCGHCQLSRPTREQRGGMRLRGNAAPIEQVATKQREVFQRLCNMYMVTLETARPEGISGA